MRREVLSYMSEFDALLARPKASTLRRRAEGARW